MLVNCHGAEYIFQISKRVTEHTYLSCACRLSWRNIRSSISLWYFSLRSSSFLRKAKSITGGGGGTVVAGAVGGATIIGFILVATTETSLRSDMTLKAVLWNAVVMSMRLASWSSLAVCATCSALAWRSALVGLPPFFFAGALWMKGC